MRLKEGLERMGWDEKCVNVEEGNGDRRKEEEKKERKGDGMREVFWTTKSWICCGRGVCSMSVI